MEGGGVEQCEKRRGRGESLLSGVCWWMVHSVWLRAHMNKHIRLLFAAHSKCKPLIMQWDDIKKKGKWGEKNVIWLWLLLQGDLVIAELLMMFWRVRFWTMDFSFPNENKLNTSSEYTLNTLILSPGFIFKFCFVPYRKQGRYGLYVIT